MKLYDSTVAIGDVHGSTYWHKIIEDHPNDRIVFLGDYCDPYEEFEDEDILDNLWNILALKKMNPERVILLLGNHDMHYIFDEDTFPQGSRYNERLAERLHKLFTENRELFQFAFQDGNFLYTHAGMSEVWVEDYLKAGKEDLANIADLLNNPNPEQFKAMCQVGFARGGWDYCGGIFWADFSELVTPAKGFNQIVGHNQVDKVITYKPDDDSSITFCDCLRKTKQGYIV